MKLTTASVLIFFVLAALPSLAEIKVEQQEGVDFTGRTTFAWRDAGTEAARPEVQRWVVEAVERELKARGLRKVQDRRADLYVVTHAFAQMDAKAQSHYLHLDTYDVGVIRAEPVLMTTGVLVVDLFEGDGEKPSWRGMANEVMGDPSLEKVHKKVDKVVRKMFKSYPAAKH